MRIIIKALVALFFLLPTLVAAEPASESRFIRIQRDDNSEMVALQTAIAKYVAVGGVQGVEVDLVAAVHVGEESYYRRLNKEFEKYDVVLYELVATEGAKPPKSGEREVDNPVAALQLLMKFLLRLEHQLEFVDYEKSNFTHADLSLEGMRQAIRNRGENEMTVILSALSELMQQMREHAGKSVPQTPTFGLEDLLNATKLKRLLAQQFEAAGGDAGFGRTINRSLVEDRNTACMKVLKEQLAAGKKKVAIFYGAAHMPDFEERLKNELGMTRTSNEWIDAWNLK